MSNRSGAKRATGMPPDGSGTARPKRAIKVLVVEADYFPLTTRIDNNVIFWPAGIAESSVPIPRGITHLWVHKECRGRGRLHKEAEERGITVWRCQIGELRNRLYGVWEERGNRSLILPYVEGEAQKGSKDDLSLRETGEDLADSVRLDTAVRMVANDLSSVSADDEIEEEDDVWDEERRSAHSHNIRLGLAQRKRRKLLLQAGFRLLMQKDEAARDRVSRTLALYSPLERQVFSAVFGVGKPAQSPAKVAKLFLMKEKVVVAMADKVWSGLLL